jgi:hypothetical protein
MKLSRKLGVFALTASMCFVNVSEKAHSKTTVTKIEMPPLAVNTQSEFRVDNLIKTIIFILFPVCTKIIIIINFKICLDGMLTESISAIYPGWRCSPYKFRENFCLEFKTPQIAIETRTVVKE